MMNLLTGSSNLVIGGAHKVLSKPLLENRVGSCPHGISWKMRGGIGGNYTRMLRRRRLPLGDAGSCNGIGWY